MEFLEAVWEPVAGMETGPDLVESESVRSGCRISRIAYLPCF
jgi:hypothetical protein